MAHVIMPVPSLDFDPTEVAVSWQVLTQLGHKVSFATPDGRPGQADEMMLTGQGLDPWGFVPGINKLPLIGLALRANKDARRAYSSLEASPEFRSPRRWIEIRTQDFDALLLPGGHRARGMRPYLESSELQSIVVDFFSTIKPIGAICHGVLLAVRSIDPSTGHSVLYGRKTTGLTWQLERAGARVGSFARFWDPNYYRTYPDRPGDPVGYRSLQQEVSRLLQSSSDFLDVPKTDPNYALKTSGRARDSLTDSRPAWVIRDGRYVSARWPGDAFTFAKTFSQLVDELMGKAASAEPDSIALFRQPALTGLRPIR